MFMKLKSVPTIRWTGSNTNPNNNDGQGRDGTDRSNVVMLRPPNYPEGDGSAGTASGHWGNSYPAHLDDNTTSFLGLSREDRQNLATLLNSEPVVVYVRDVSSGDEHLCVCLQMPNASHTHTHTHTLCKVNKHQ